MTTLDQELVDAVVERLLPDRTGPYLGCSPIEAFRIREQVLAVLNAAIAAGWTPPAVTPVLIDHADRIEVTWPAGRGQTIATPEVVEGWAEQVNQLRADLATAVEATERARATAVRLEQELAEARADLGHATDGRPVIGRSITVAIFGDLDRDHPIEDEVMDAAVAACERRGFDWLGSSGPLYEPPNPTEPTPRSGAHE